jgi:23S rRNA pseudouridine1911/1915/1917 synthase
MSFTVEDAEAGQALAGFLRGRHPDKPWREVKRWIATGKVFVDGAVVEDEGARVRAGQTVEVRMTAPRRVERSVRIVYEDAQLVVIDKPAGVSSVPYAARGGRSGAEPPEGRTAIDLVRDAWRRLGRPATAQALFVVHRIDKETSGLLAYAKTKTAERGLGGQFRAHTVERLYVCVAHGEVRAARIESLLVPDRGDGLRGSTRRPGQGKRAVTHVEPVEALRGATLCHVRLETGKTHQIRVHLAEAGHPLVGEKVYIRDFKGDVIPSARLLLHAATLGFRHPTTEAPLSFEAPLPEDFRTELARLSSGRGRRSPPPAPGAAARRPRAPASPGRRGR